MADTNSPKRVAFEEPHSSASDEDRNPVEVVFEDANPYRRKSSLVASDAVPPHLRRAPPPPHQKTECLVHQFLANQRKPKPSFPTHARHQDQDQGEDQDQGQGQGHHEHHGHHGHRDHHNTTHVHHHHAGTASCEAEDISSEAGLDRPLDPKGGSSSGDGKGNENGPASHPKPKQDDGKHIHRHHHSHSHSEEEEHARPCATILRDSHSASEDETATSETDPNGDGLANSGAHCGQVDEKEWRRSMVGGGGGSEDAVSRTPSQLDRRSASEDAPNSRLLTKKQLSEMAWGVRELSRRLGSMRLKFRVKTIFVLTKIYDAELILKTRELCAWLLDRERDVRYTIYVDRELKENKRFDVAGLIEGVRKDYVKSGEVSEEASWDVGKRLKFWDEALCRARPHTFDFAITLGGDGTVLYASWLFQRIVPPVLSFALGSLGFLTKFDFEDHAKTLTSAFNEGVTVSLRLRFEATVMRSQKTKSRVKWNGLNGDDEEPPRDLVEELIGEEQDDEHTHHPEGTYEVLNEVVVDRGPNPSKTRLPLLDIPVS